MIYSQKPEIQTPTQSRNAFKIKSTIYPGQERIWSRNKRTLPRIVRRVQAVLRQERVAIRNSHWRFVFLGPFYLTRANFSQFSRKNGSRYPKTFCGRLISEKFHVLKTPWNSLPVNFKPEVTGNDDVIMTSWCSSCSSWLTDHDDGSYES